MNDPTAPKAKVVDVMKFFGYTKVSDFHNDWKKLTKEEKDWFCVEVYKAMM